MHSVELKKTTIQKLKKELETIERDTETRLVEIDNTNSELKVYFNWSMYVTRKSKSLTDLSSYFLAPSASDVDLSR